MSNSEQYSTLEVRHSSDLPEVVDPGQFEKEFAGPHPVPGQPQYTNGALNPYPPAEGYYHGHGIPPGAAGAQSPMSPYSATSMGTYQNSPTGLYDANAAKMAYGQNGQPLPPTDGAVTDEKKAAPRKICGVAPLIFYIALGVTLVVIIAAVVGGVVGSMASKNRGDGQSDASTDTGSGDNSTTSDTPLILSGSRLTSTNWTDPDGVVHRAVFFQDVHAAIVACQWDSDSKKWGKTNITELLAPSTSPIDAVSGTPLAVAAIDDNSNGASDFELHLWYLNSTSYIKSVARTNLLDNAVGWKIDSLSDAGLQTRPGSLLAATWQRPSTSDALGNWIVAYQRPSDGAIKTANSSHWEVSDEAVPGDTVVNNSSMAIIPQRRGTFLDRVQLVSQGLGTDPTGSLQLSTYDNGWDLSNRDVLAKGLPNPSLKQHFAATQWGNWANYLYLALLDNGDVVGNYFENNNFNNIDKATFSGGPDQNFTAISMTNDAMFYAISNDEVLEYSVDTLSPSTLKYVGTVFSASDDN